MGFRDWLAGRKTGDRHAATPSRPASPGAAPIDVMEEAIRHCREQGGDGWVTFKVVGEDRRERILEVAGDHVNTCLEEVDVPALLRVVGLTELADTAVAGNSGIWTFRAASPAELAAAADAVFRLHYRMGEAYTVRADVQS